MKKMKIPRLLLVIVAVTLTAVGCSQSKSGVAGGNRTNTASAPAGQNEKMQKPDGRKDADDHAGDVVKLAGTRIDLQNINNLKPGNVTLAFKLFGLDTHEFGANDLKINQEKPMHLLLVRNDLTGYQHVHPDYAGERWTATTQVPQSGNYNLYVDIEPIEEQAVVLRVPVVIGEPTQKKNFPSVSKNFSETLGNLEAKLAVATPIKTKEQVRLTFTLTQNNTPVTQIEPYLGAFGHAVAFSHTDLNYFEHAHPVTRMKPADGSVQFEAEFPANGMYTIFAQFNISGQVKTFPLTIEVGSGNDAPKGQTGGHM